MSLKLFLKAQLFVLFFLSIFFGLTALGLGAIAYGKFRQFSSASGLSLTQVKDIVKQGWNQTPTSTNGRVNFLILGLDSLKTRGDVPPLTDTMMMVSLNLSNGQINTLSFPRDLWHEGYQTRINALYFYGQERYPAHPEQFSKEVLSEMTGVPIHYTVVLSFEQVSQLIDLLGGVEIDVPTAFVDESFPRTDVDVTVVKDPKLLYKTVSFPQGKQVMSGEKALEYMRSRKSGDDEGTDVARGARQQLVLDSVLAKLKQKDTITNPQLLGNIYKYYEQNFAKIISPSEAVSLAKALYPVRNQITTANHNISIYPDDEAGVIFHPEPRKYKGEWIYVIREAQLFMSFVQDKLGVKQ